MSSADSLLKRSLGIFHSCLLFVFAVYMLDVTFARWNYLGLNVLALTFIVPAKVYLLSGFYGMLVEIASGEEILFKFKNFHKNAKQYWKIYLLLHGALLASHGLLFFTTPYFSKIPYETFTAYFHIVVLFGLAYFIIKDKYSKYHHWKLLGGQYSTKILGLVLIVYFIQLALFNIPNIISFESFDLSRPLWIFHHSCLFLLYIMAVHIILEQHPQLSDRFVSDKEIYLINPLGGGITFHISSYFWRNMYPSLFVIIKALTPKGYTFREFNRHTWENRYFTSGKLVVITCFTSGCADAYRIARGFKEMGSKVIMGGPHASYLYDEALEFCDSVVVGEVESVWGDIVHDYEQDKLKPLYRGVATEDCHALIHQELLRSPPEVIKDVLETTRGCKFRCKFCAVPSLSSGKIRKKGIDELVELIKKIKHRYKHILFIDNNIYSDPAYAKELFAALKPLEIKWSTQCTIDIAKNDKMLKLAKESGCSNLLIGFEIVEGSFEKEQGGKLSMVDRYNEYARKIKKMGINIKAHFIFGFESDSFKSLLRFWKACFSIYPWATVLSLLTPYPGTKLYDEMITKDQVTNLNWRNYGSQSLVFRHEKMNNVILLYTWPAIYVFFLLTTSRLGNLLALLIGLILVRAL